MRKRTKNSNFFKTACHFIVNKLSVYKRNSEHVNKYRVLVCIIGYTCILVLELNNTRELKTMQQDQAFT